MKPMSSKVVYAACAAASLLALGGAQSSLAQSSKGYTKQELAALKIVHDSDEGWKAKSADQIAANFADDIIVSDPTITRETGANNKEKFINSYNHTMVKFINYYDVVSRYAAGGPGQVVVVEKRRDHAKFNGKDSVLPFVGFFRVKDGKIIEWQDISIGNMPLGPPPGGGAGGPPGGPPGGAPPAGGPAPGGPPPAGQ
jgi:limonene-1,2-epoxide hydrolase